MGFARFFSLFAPLAIVAACSSSNSTNATPGGGGGDDGGTPGTDGGKDAPTSACNLQPITGAAEVVPTFKFFDPPSSVPTPMTGGTPSGKFVVSSAVFFLPTNTKSVAHPD